MNYALLNNNLSRSAMKGRVVDLAQFGVFTVSMV